MVVRREFDTFTRGDLERVFGWLGSEISIVAFRATLRSTPM